MSTKWHRITWKKEESKLPSNRANLLVLEVKSCPQENTKKNEYKIEKVHVHGIARKVITDYSMEKYIKDVFV